MVKPTNLTNAALAIELSGERLISTALKKRDLYVHAIKFAEL